MKLEGASFQKGTKLSWEKYGNDSGRLQKSKTFENENLQ